MSLNKEVLTSQNVLALLSQETIDLIDKNYGTSFGKDIRNYLKKKFSVAKKFKKRVIRNFKHEAELLVIDHFNGIENNFGFTKF